jgi:hypothetical protein
MAVTDDDVITASDVIVAADVCVIELERRNEGGGGGGGSSSLLGRPCELLSPPVPGSDLTSGRSITSLPTAEVT